MQNPNPNIIQNNGQNVGNVSIPVSANMLPGQIPPNLNIHRAVPGNPNMTIGANQMRQFQIPSQPGGRPAILQPTSVPVSASATGSVVTIAQNNPNMPNNPQTTTTAQMRPIVPETEAEIVSRQKLQEMLQQISPNMKMDPDVEDLLLEIADDFVESVTVFACNLAKHRKANALEVKDLQMNLERNWNIHIPGFSNDESSQKNDNNSASEAHKQKLELLKKAQAS